MPKEHIHSGMGGFPPPMEGRLCVAPETRLDYSKFEEGGNRSISAFGSVPTF